MSSRILILCVLAGLLGAGCSDVNRTASLNQDASISGTTVASSLDRDLTKQGLSDAKVSCATTVLVQEGAVTSCVLTGPGSNRTVRFTFNSHDGHIDRASVKAS